MRSADGDRWLLAWGLGSVAAGAASLLVPLYVVELGGGPVELGVLAASAALVGAPGAIAAGTAADGAGNRRRLLLGTLAGLAATFAVFPLLSSVPAVVVVNAGLWLVWAAAAPVVTMLAVDGAPESAWNRRIGRLNAYQGYGWAGGLVLGLAWTAVGSRFVPPRLAQQSLFLACGLCAAAAFLATARALPPEAAAHSAVQTRRIRRFVLGTRRGIKGATFLFAPNRLYWATRDIHPRRLFERVGRPLAAYLVAAALFFAGTAAFWAPLPALLADYGSDLVFGLYLASSLVSALLYGPAGRLGDRYDLRTVLAGALGGRGLLFPLVAVVPAAVAATALPATAVLLALVGATWAVIAVAGTAMVTRLAPPALRAEAVGIYTALGAIAGAAGGLLGGALAASSYGLAFAVAGALVLAGGALVAGTKYVTDPP